MLVVPLVTANHKLLSGQLLLPKLYINATCQRRL